MFEYQGAELELFQFATNWKTYFSSKIKNYIQGNVLEVGAGFGSNTRYLITDDAISWTFIEPDSTLANKILGFTSDINLPKKVVVGTIDSVNHQKFDTIIYIDVLEHIEASGDEIRKISSILKTGGHLIILVPAFQFLFNEFDNKIGHFRRYNMKMLRNDINSLLVERKLFYLDSCGLLASIFNRYFLKKSEINTAQVKFWDGILIPLSRITDVITYGKFGKSLVGIYEKRSQNDQINS